MEKLSELDKNLAVCSILEEEDIAYTDVSQSPFEIYGAADVQKYGYLRMPPVAAAAVSDGVAQLMPCTSGIRVRFSTNSPHIAIRCTFESAGRLTAIMPLLGSAGFDLYEDHPDGRKSTFRGAFLPPEGITNGYEAILYVGAGSMRAYTIHFPLYTRVTSVYIGLSKTAVVSAGAKYRSLPPVAYYGSSITMGGCASRPGNCYPSIVARTLNTDFINLGFAGNAKGEPAMADYLAELATSALVIDYDHNAPTVEHLMETYEPFFCSIRQRRPGLPVLFVTRPDFETNPPDSDLRRKVIRKTFDTAVKNGDRQVYFVDGEELFGIDARTDCTVDGVHPNDLGFYRIACGISAVLAQMLGL